MRTDFYLRAVLTVIAAALVYLCVLFTPMPSVMAQQPGRVVGAPTPGVSTGPAEMVIVGWQLPGPIPVQVAGGEVHVTNEVRVAGRVVSEPAANTATKTLLVGWEEGAVETARREFVGGTFRSFSERERRALPVVVRPPTP